MAFSRKLTDEQVAEILDRRSKGEAYNKIAVDYDISGSRVYELTHPEIQAAKQAKMKERNAQKRAAAKLAKAGAVAEVPAEDLSGMDLSEVDDEPEIEAEVEGEAELDLNESEEEGDPELELS